MPPELQAVIRELEAQRADLLSGASVSAAFEKMGSRAAEAVFAAAKAEARAEELGARLKELEAEVAELKKPKAKRG